MPDDEPDEPEDVSLPQPIVPIPMPMIRKKANINPVIFRFMFSPPFSFYSYKSKKAITATSLYERYCKLFARNFLIIEYRKCLKIKEIAKGRGSMVVDICDSLITKQAIFSEIMKTINISSNYNE